MPRYMMKSPAKGFQLDMHELPRNGDLLNLGTAGTFMVMRIEHMFYNSNTEGEARQRQTVVYVEPMPGEYPLQL